MKRIYGYVPMASREFTTVECTMCSINTSNLWVVYWYNYESIHVETVTTNREIVANHLVYTLLYIFLVAGI